jgi:PPOX class probable F420-dependent enzyme
MTEEQLHFLENSFAGIVTTVRADGSPHNTVVWVDVDNGLPSFNTAAGRAKPNHLKADQRVALTVVDPSDMYRWLAIDGHAEVTTDGAEEQINKLSRKYDGKDWEYRPGEQRLKIRIHPDHVTAYGFD